MTGGDVQRCEVTGTANSKWKKMTGIETARYEITGALRLKREVAGKAVEVREVRGA